MGGNYVYPGGKVDEEDATEEILACSQVSLHKCPRDSWGKMMLRLPSLIG